MNKKFILLLLLFLGMGIAAFFLSKKNSGVASSLDTDDKNFAIQDTAAIGKLFIANKKGETVTLTRQNAAIWLYNNQHKVRSTAINMLLETLHGVQLKYTLPRATIPNVVKDIASEGLKVEIYDTKNNPIKVFYIGGAIPDGRGTYMIRENADTPYAMSVTGWEGDIRTAFNMFQADDWRDRTVFRENAQKIQSVSVEYPKQKAFSFRLEKQIDGTFQVAPFYSTTPTINKLIKKGTPEAYLLGFERVVAESFLSDAPQKDSVRALVPFSIVTIKDMEGKEKQLKLFPYTSYDRNGDVRTKNENFRYYADCSNGDFMLVQHPVIGKLLWAYSFFY